MANGKKVAGVNVDMTLELASFKQSCREAETVTKQMTAQMKEEMGKSRESVRLLSEELGLGIPRGLQGIISKLPGITTAMNLAFNAVVVFALINTIVEVTKKVEEFAKKNEEAAAKHAAAWESFDHSTRNTNDSLDLTIIKLDNAHAKFEHKPENKMAEALQEAINKADELGEKLSADAALISKNLEDEQVGLLGKYMGQDDSWAVKRAKALKEELAGIDVGPDVVQDMSKQYRSKRATDAAVEEAQGHLTTAQGQQAQDRKDAGSGPYIEYRQPDIDATTTLIQKAGILSGLITKNDTAAIATAQGNIDKGKADAAALSKSEAEKLLKQMEQELKTQKAAQFAIKAIQAVTVEDEIQFWSDRLAAFGQGSSEYNAVQDKIWSGYEARSKQFEAIRKSTAIKNVPDGIMDSINMEPREGGDKIAEELAKGYEAYAKFGAELDQAKLKALESTHILTPHAAALAEAALHAKEYAAALVPLNDQLEKLKKIQAKNPSDENQAKMMVVGNQLSQVTYKYQTQQVVDAASADMPNAMQDWISKATDLKSIMGSLFTESINQVNEAIIKLITTKDDPHPFRAAGHAIATDVASVGLKSAEGEFGKFLFGSGKVMDVRIVGGMPGLPGGAGGASSTMSNGIGGLLGTLLGFGGAPSDLLQKGTPGHAGGGVINPGDWSMVGEAGPELAHFGSGAKIYSNRDTTAMMRGGGTTHNYNIDATGSNDPAATRAAVERGIKAAAPHIVAASQAANKEQQRRGPVRSR